MSGYSWIHGMSNNAVMAYEDGLLPASKIKEVPTNLIRIFVDSEEWHHTSKFFNRTEFYNSETVLKTFGLLDDTEDEFKNDYAIEALRVYNLFKTLKTVVTVGYIYDPSRDLFTEEPITLKLSNKKVIFENGFTVDQTKSVGTFNSCFVYDGNLYKLNRDGYYEMLHGN